LSLVNVFRAKVVDISHTRMVIEASGNREKVEAFVEMLRPLGINDITRTGYIAIGRLSATEEIAERAVSAQQSAFSLKS
jgi:acetolactate synthase-1/3 small subunit